MKQYIVNFTGVKTVWYFYEVLIKGLELPEWCGKNPDAIWDLLTGHVEYPAIIYIQGIKSLPKNLHEESEIILGIFNRVHNYYSDSRFDIKILD